MKRIKTVISSIKKDFQFFYAELSGQNSAVYKKRKINNGKEKRLYARYTIKAPASLTLETSPSIACMLFVHDISSGGALVSTTFPIQKNEKVTLRTKLPFQETWLGRDTVEFIFRGKVIRITKTGKIAIQFDDDFRISTALPD